jgi:hypothetical protein
VSECSTATNRRGVFLYYSRKGIKMLKYLDDLSANFAAMKAGIIANAALWSVKNITGDTVQAFIDRIAAANKAVEALQLQLSQAFAAARELEGELSNTYSTYVKFATGLNSDNPNKLLEYGLSPRKEASAKPAPGKKLKLDVSDDTDGIGFILLIEKDSDADMYECYKGISADATKTDVIPVLSPFKTTRKLSFVDDDVVKGQRVWYKVRAMNAAGEGPWSEPVSRVQ